MAQEGKEKIWGGAREAMSISAMISIPSIISEYILQRRSVVGWKLDR